MKATVETFTGVAAAKEEMIRNKFGQYWVLSMLAGMYIGFGILLIFTVGAQFASTGSVAVKMIMGISFGIALTLVVFAGAELFTGNNMTMLIGCLRGKTSWAWMAWLWFVCYFGNLAGALLLAWVMACTGLADGNVTGKFIGQVTSAKMNAPWMELFCRGILCNALVCLAVWMSAKCKNETARVFLIFWCLFAFIACGFEHSIANMTLFAVSLFTEHPDTVSWYGFARNQLPVTIGNIIGGGFFGLVYWFATYAPVQSLVPEETDGGLSISLVDPTQGAVPGGQVLGIDENDNLIIGRPASQIKQMVLHNQMVAVKAESYKIADSSHTQDLISTTGTCVKELTRWCDQLSAILIHLRSRALKIGLNEFSEILTQLSLQKDNGGSVYIKDEQVRRLAEDKCPDFEKYSRGKETIEFFSSYGIIPANARKGITEVLQLCNRVETTASRVTNPVNYGINPSAVLAEAVFELNEIRLDLNGRFSALYNS